tara:strand:+ start:995 stop:1783 length:789 start_codon:yes stop_codon:yes gene_type:complete
MPTFQNTTFSSFFKRILQVSQTSNTGVDATTRAVQTGDGVATSISISDDVLSVQPQNDNTTGAFLVKNQGGSNILAVDTTNSLVKAGVSQVNTLTMVKEMGLYEFSPNTAGYHYPLIANRVGMQGAEALTYDEDWGNGTDPSATLDVSGLTDPENAIAVYWYLDNNITLDSVRFLAIADGSVTLNFHLESYTLDTSSNHGDLSSGTTCASASVSATATTVKTGTFTLDSADIDSGKVVVGFVENATDTSDVSCSFQINYHIR